MKPKHRAIYDALTHYPTEEAAKCAARVIAAATERTQDVHQYRKTGLFVVTPTVRDKDGKDREARPDADYKFFHYRFSILSPSSF